MTRENRSISALAIEEEVAKEAYRDVESESASRQRTIVATVG
jgi:hypothetical protein